MRVKEESEKASLKLNIQNTKVMVSSPITLWQIDGKKVETDFLFLGSKITADDDCSHKIKRHFLLGRKAMTNLESILKKQRHHFANRGPYIQSYGFFSSHVQIESWTIKKAECQRTVAFKLWCWRRLLRVRWTAKRSNCCRKRDPLPELESGLLSNTQKLID